MRNLEKLTNNDFPGVSHFRPSTTFEKSGLDWLETTGLIVPWTRDFGGVLISDFKIVMDDGEEYFLLTNSKWGNTLGLFEWWTVRIGGRFNRLNSVLIPENIVPLNQKRKYEN